MKKGKKKYIIIIIILIIYLLLMYVFIGRDNLKDSKNKTTLIVGNNTVWSYSNKKWHNVKDSNEISTFDWEKFSVSVDGKKLGKKYLVFSDKWYLFDNNKKAVNYVGKLFAYKSNNNMNLLDFEINPITDFTYVNEVLSNLNISTLDFAVSNIVSVDFDNDGVDEDFYIISNSFITDPIPDKYFSIVFMVKDNNIYLLYNNTNIKDVYSGCIPYIDAFINVDKDSIHEVVISCDKYSIQGSIDMLYKYNDNRFHILIYNNN